MLWNTQEQPRCSIDGGDFQKKKQSLNSNTKSECLNAVHPLCVPDLARGCPLSGSSSNTLSQGSLYLHSLGGSCSSFLC